MGRNKNKKENTTKINIIIGILSVSVIVIIGIIIIKSTQSQVDSAAEAKAAEKAKVADRITFIEESTYGIYSNKKIYSDQDGKMYFGRDSLPGASSDWFPKAPKEPNFYKVDIQPNGTIYYGGKKYPGENNEKNPKDDLTFSYLMTPRGDIYAFSYRHRKRHMCGDNETDPICSSLNTECCFYHGKLASKLVLEKIIDKPIFQSGGEFVLNSKFPHQIISVANQSGHFHPPDFSNKNFITELSKKINNKFPILILNWQTGYKMPKYTIVRPKDEQRGGDKKIRRKHNKPFKKLIKKLYFM